MRSNIDLTSPKEITEIILYASIYASTLITATKWLLPLSKICNAPGYTKLKIKEEYHSRIPASLIALFCSFHFLKNYLPLLIGFFTDYDWVKQTWIDYSIHIPDSELQFPGSGNIISKTQSLILKNVLAYMLVDLVWMLYYKYYDIPMFVHHSVVIYACFLGEPHANCFCGTAMELSNVLVQLRWYWKYYELPKLHIVEIIFACWYWFVRLIIGGFGSYLIFTAAEVTYQGLNWISTKWICALIMVLNLGFSFGVFQMLRKSIRRYRQGRGNGAVRQTDSDEADSDKND